MIPGLIVIGGILFCLATTLEGMQGDRAVRLALRAADNERATELWRWNRMHVRARGPRLEPRALPAAPARARSCVGDE